MNDTPELAMMLVEERAIRRDEWEIEEVASAIHGAVQAGFRRRIGAPGAMAELSGSDEYVSVLVVWLEWRLRTRVATTSRYESIAYDLAACAVTEYHEWCEWRFDEYLTQI